MKDSFGILNKAFLFFLALAFLPGNLQSQTFSELHSFISQSQLPDATGGTAPGGDLVLTNGVLYGITASGGDLGYGSIYSINTDGTGFNVIYNCTNEASALVLLDQKFFATTYFGGTNNDGTIFSVGTNGMASNVIYQFSGSGDGAFVMTLISDGNRLYGATYCSNLFSYIPSGPGTIFSINTNGGDFKVLHAFDQRQSARSLVLKDGILYGAAPGLSNNIFSISTNGADFTGLYTFTNEINPYQLILNQGVLYGIGVSNSTGVGGIIFSLNTDGSDFNVLHVFTNTPEQYFLVILNNNLLCGSTLDGGLYNTGTIFSMKTNGSGFNILYDFPNGSYYEGNGASGLIPNGNALLGTFPYGGTNHWGSIFSLDLAPTAQNITCTNGNFNMVWTAASGATYQFQYSTNLPSTNWLNLGGCMTATTTNLFMSDPITNFQRFYRLIYQP